MGKLYFAHPINMYGDWTEKDVLKQITDYFNIGLDDIENPNQEHHQAGYRVDGMSYFYDQVLPSCSGVVAVPFLDGKFGLGVAGEAKCFLERNRPVYILSLAHISHDAEFHNGLPLFTIREIDTIPEHLVLSHEETRLRLWRKYGKVARLYTEAHLASLPLPGDFYS